MPVAVLIHLLASDIFCAIIRIGRVMLNRLSARYLRPTAAHVGPSQFSGFFSFGIAGGRTVCIAKALPVSGNPACAATVEIKLVRSGEAFHDDDSVA